MDNKTMMIAIVTAVLGAIGGANLQPTNKPDAAKPTQASGETTINNQVAVTWVRVADKTVIYLAHATAKDARFVEIVADEKALTVTPDKRIGAGMAP